MLCVFFFVVQEFRNSPGMKFFVGKRRVSKHVGTYGVADELARPPLLVPTCPDD